MWAGRRVDVMGWLSATVLVIGLASQTAGHMTMVCTSTPTTGTCLNGASRGLTLWLGSYHSNQSEAGPAIEGTVELVQDESLATLGATVAPPPPGVSFSTTATTQITFCNYSTAPAGAIDSLRAALAANDHACTTVPFAGRDVGAVAPSPFVSGADVQCYNTRESVSSPSLLVPVTTGDPFCDPFPNTGFQPATTTWYGVVIPGAVSARYRLNLRAVGERLDPSAGNVATKCVFAPEGNGADEATATVEVQVPGCGQSCVVAAQAAPLALAIGAHADRVDNASVSTDPLCRGGGALPDGHRCFPPTCLPPFTLVFADSTPAVSCVDGDLTGAFGCLDCTACGVDEVQISTCRVVAGQFGGGPSLQDRTCVPRTEAPTTASPTIVPSSVPTAAPSAIPTALPTHNPTALPTIVPTEAPTAAPTAAPTGGPTRLPTDQPTVSPTVEPTAEPTAGPTVQPTREPSSAPTGVPTLLPTTSPTSFPTAAPTKAPTVAPTAAPTVSPVAVPTTAPTVSPSNGPTAAPSLSPTQPCYRDPGVVDPAGCTVAAHRRNCNVALDCPLIPDGAVDVTFSESPCRSLLTVQAVCPDTCRALCLNTFDGDSERMAECFEQFATFCSASPTLAPTAPPTQPPTAAPTFIPTPTPTVSPTAAPTAVPTLAPSAAPTDAPTAAPSTAPSTSPTSAPTVLPTTSPSAAPTSAPNAAPSAAPSVAPTAGPTASPSTSPTAIPTVTPTATPTAAPSALPTHSPTAQPTTSPTTSPTPTPTATPTTNPSAAPTFAPSATPTATPTTLPTAEPTTAPSAAPSMPPTAAPSARPTVAPTTSPTAAPSAAPTFIPTANPTNAPTAEPTRSPTPACPGPNGAEPDPAGCGGILNVDVSCSVEAVFTTCRATCGTCPTPAPTSAPTVPPTTPSPTASPTARPTSSPSARPTHAPTAAPSAAPSADPTHSPTPTPTLQPTTAAPTFPPTSQPTVSPTHLPTALPSVAPTSAPTESPTATTTATTTDTTTVTTTPAVCTGNAVVGGTSTASVLASQFGDCDAIEGNVSVSNAAVDESALSTIFSSLRYLRGDLFVNFNGNVADMSWLSRLETVSGSIYIQFNGLESLSGLERLALVEGSVSITYNGNLADACAIFPVTVHGLFDIAFNAEFVRLPALFLEDRNRSFEATCAAAVTTATTTQTTTQTTTGSTTVTSTQTTTPSTSATSTVTTTPLISVGDVVLNGTNGQVVDIGGAIADLANVDIVSGSVLVVGTSITSQELTALLHNVVEVQGTLVIEQNHDLSAVVGLQHVRVSTLRVVHNPVLVLIQGVGLLDTSSDSAVVITNNPVLAQVCGIVSSGSVSIVRNPLLRRLEPALQQTSGLVTHDCERGSLNLLSAPRCQQTRVRGGGLALASNPFVTGPTLFTSEVIMPPGGSGYVFSKSVAATGARYFGVYLHSDGRISLYYMCADQVQRRVRWRHSRLDDSSRHTLAMSFNDAVAGLSVDGLSLGVQPLTCAPVECGHATNSTSCRAHIGQREADSSGRTFTFLGCVLTAEVVNTNDALFDGGFVDLRRGLIDASSAVTSYIHGAASPVPSRASGTCPTGPLLSAVPRVSSSFSAVVVFKSDAAGTGHGYLLAKTGVGRHRYFSLYVARTDHRLTFFYSAVGTPSIQRRVSFPANLRDGNIHTVVVSVKSGPFQPTVGVNIDGVRTHVAELPFGGVDDCETGTAQSCTLHIGQRNSGNFPFTGGCVLLAHLFPNFANPYPSQPMLSAFAAATTAPPTAAPTAQPSRGYGDIICVASEGTSLLLVNEPGTCLPHTVALNSIILECDGSRNGRFGCVDATEEISATIEHQGFTVDPDSAGEFGCELHAALLNQAIRVVDGHDANFSCRGGGFLIHTAVSGQPPCGTHTTASVAALNRVIRSFYSNSFTSCTAAPTALPTAAPTAAPTGTVAFTCERFTDSNYISVSSPAEVTTVRRLQELAQQCSSRTLPELAPLAVSSSITGVGAVQGTGDEDGEAFAEAVNLATAAYSIGQVYVHDPDFTSTNFSFFSPTQLLVHRGLLSTCERIASYLNQAIEAAEQGIMQSCARDPHGQPCTSHLDCEPGLDEFCAASCLTANCHFPSDTVSACAPCALCNLSTSVTGTCTTCRGSGYPTAVPTAAPSATPSAAPSFEPTPAPSAEPTAVPTVNPSASPTALPTTASPTRAPTAVPTRRPTLFPTQLLSVPCDPEAPCCEPVLLGTAPDFTDPHFSISIRFRSVPGAQGYLFAKTDMVGFRHLGLRVVSGGVEVEWATQAAVGVQQRLTVAALLNDGGEHSVTLRTDGVSAHLVVDGTATTVPLRGTLLDCGPASSNCITQVGQRADLNGNTERFAACVTLLEIGFASQLSPSHAPTSVPTAVPTAVPTGGPTMSPTATPTSLPTTLPPTAVPTGDPTANPTAVPTSSPTPECVSNGGAGDPAGCAVIVLERNCSLSVNPVARTDCPQVAPENAPVRYVDSPCFSFSAVRSVCPELCRALCLSSLATDVESRNACLAEYNPFCSRAPSAVPTNAPSTLAPTHVPTNSPTLGPTAAPSRQPTSAPTFVPTTAAPTARPTERPTTGCAVPIGPDPESCANILVPHISCSNPQIAATCIGTCQLCPTAAPTAAPSAVPTFSPTAAPTAGPTTTPSVSPTAEPTAAPTAAPSAAPSASPSAHPTAVPTSEPTPAPSAAPSAAPSFVPTASPTAVPSSAPSTAPSHSPSAEPTAAPTAAPSVVPTAVPSAAPSSAPTEHPSAVPTVAPTALPSLSPSASPSPLPSAVPTTVPTAAPTAAPTRQPSANPTAVPTAAPTNCGVNLAEICGNRAQTPCGTPLADLLCRAPQPEGCCIPDA